MATKKCKTQDDMIAETHDTVIKLKTVLLGTNGDNGMCGDLKRTTKRVGKLERNFWLFVGTVIGSGILGGSVWGIIQAMN